MLDFVHVYEISRDNNQENIEIIDQFWYTKILAWLQDSGE